MKASRTHTMNWSHKPVTRATPTAISMMPPTIWMSRACVRNQPRLRSAHADENARMTNGMPRPAQYAMISATPFAAVAPCVPLAVAMTAASVGPRHGSSRARRPRRAVGLRRCWRRCAARSGTALHHRDESDEDEAHHDRHHPADALQHIMIDDHGARDTEDRRRRGDEDHREAEDEQRRRDRHP